MKKNWIKHLGFVAFLGLSAPVFAATPTFSVAYSPTTIAPGATSTMTYTIDNTANTTIGVSQLSFSNTLPAGMTIKNPNNLSTTCLNGTLVATAGSSTITFSDYRLAAKQTCTVQLDVTSSTGGSHTNTTGALTSSEGSSGTASATLTVDTARPGFSAAFSPSTITPGGISTLTYTVDNSLNGANALLLTVSDTLPSGVVVAAQPNASSTCNQTFTPIFTVTPGGSTFLMQAGGVGAGSSCTIQYDVTAPAVGNYIHTSGQLSQNGSNPSGSATAELTVSVPFMYMQFPNFASPGQSINLSYTITNTDRNNDATSLTFTDDLNAALSGLAATSLPSTGFCGSGSTISGTSNLTISNVTVASGSSCTFSVTVLVPSNAAAGSYTNNTSTINLDLGGATTKAAVSNTLNIKKAPVLTAQFIGDPVIAGQDVTLRYTLTNTDTANAATAIGFTELINNDLGMVVKTLPAANSCGSGSSFSQLNSSGAISTQIVNASLSAGANCTFDYVLTVPADAQPGNYTMTTSTVSSTIAGSGVFGAATSDTLTVLAAPSLQFSIDEASTTPGGTVTAQFTLNYNANATADVTGVGFTVDLNGALSGLASTSSTQSNVCGSGSSFSGTSTLTLSGASLSPGGSCTFSATLQVPAGASPSTITVSTSTVTGTTSSTAVSNASVSDTFVISGLTLSHTYLTNPTLAGTNNTIRYTITNNASSPAATAMTFSHSLTGVITSMAATSLPSTPCNGSSALAGTTTIILTGGELQPGTSCSFDVPISIPANAAVGAHNSTTGALSATVNSTNTSSSASSAEITIEELTVILSTTASNPTSTSPIPAKIDFSRDVVNFVDGDLKLTNATASNFSGSGKHYTVDLTPAANGEVKLEVLANVADDAVVSSVHNSQATPLTVTYQSTPPPPTPTLVIGSPSASKTNTGPITYGVTYTDAGTVNLTTAAITLNKTGTANATVGVTGGDTATPTITLSSITGDGTLGISLAANTARNGTETAAAAGPSTTFSVDNTKPTVTITDSVATIINAPFTATITFSEAVSNFVVGDITATNASLSNFSATSSTVYTVLVTPTNQGAVKLDVAAGVADDTVSNTNTAATQHTVTYDSVAPTVSISGPNTPVNSAFTATFTFSEDVTGFAAADITATNAALSNFSATSAKVYTATVTPTAQGNVLLDIAANKAVDAATNNNTAATQYSVLYDSVKPTVSISGTSSPTNAPFTATVTFNEDVTGFTVADIAASNAQLSNFSATSAKVYTVTVTPTTDGQVTLDVSANAALDSANNGNSAATQYSLDYDGTKPALVISGSNTPVNAAFTATFTFSEDVTGFSAADISAGNASISNFSATSAKVYTATVTPSSDGNVTLDVAADKVADAAGNGNTAATQYTVTYDNTAPTIAISVPHNDINASFTATFTFSEDVTGFAAADIAVTNASVSNFNASSAKVYTATIAPSSNGTVTLNVAAASAVDQANNNNTAATEVSVNYDTVKPTVAITSAKSIVNAPFTATVTFSEDVSSFTSSDISVTNAALSSFSATSAKVYTVTVTPTSDGVVSLDVSAAAASDAAGNTNSASATLNVSYDATKPTLVINGPNGPVSTAFTATFTFSEDVTGFTSADIQATNADLSSFAATSAKVYTATVTPKVKGSVTIDVAANIAQDQADNFNLAATQYSTEFDDQLPTVSISGPTGAVNTSFVATITFSETVTNFDQTKIAVTNAQLSDFNGSSAPVYTVKVSPTAEGTLTLAVNGAVVTDTAGNPNGASNTLSLTYDTTNPTIQTLSPANNAIDVTVNPTLKITFPENVVAGASNRDASLVTGDNLISIKQVSDNTIFESVAADTQAVSISGGVVTITLAKTYTENTDFYVNIGGNAFLDSAGNAFAGITDNTTWRFKTVNLPPTATNDIAVIKEDTGTKIRVLANDNGQNSLLNPAGIKVVTAPSHGKTEMETAGGVISYIPDADFNGTDSFTYMVNDLLGTYSQPATVSITVSPVNDAPKAADDVYTTPQGTEISLNVLSNDSDPDGTTTFNRLTVVKQPAHGSVEVVNGQLRYVPLSGYAGYDFVKYSMKDPQGLSSNIATVHINVVGSNAAPVADVDSTSTQEDKSVTLSVLSNDSDTDGTIQVDSVTIVHPPSHGSASAQSDGTVIYTPETNYFGNDSFSYIVKDDGGAISNEALASISIGSNNDAPEALSDTLVLIDKVSTHTVNVLGNDIDRDGTIASITLDSQPSAGEAAVDVTNMVVNYTPSNTFSGTDSFTYHITDNNGAQSAVATVTVTETAINNPPLAFDDNVQTDEDQFVTIDVIDNDVDVDGVLVGQTLTVTSAPAHGTAQVQRSEGVIYYTPSANFNGTDKFVYQISDNGGAQATATVHIMVNSVNDAPLASANSVETNEDTALGITLSGSDNEGDSLTYHLVNGPANGVLSGTMPNLTYTPNSQYNGSDSFSYLVNDGQLDSAAATIAISVKSVNDLPVAANQQLQLVEDNRLSIRLSATDADNDALDFTIKSSPTNGTLTGSGADRVYTPAANFAGSDSFTFVATDGKGESSAATVSLTIVAVNDAPVAAGQSLTTAEETQLSVTLSATDVDSATLEYTIVSQPLNGTLSGTLPNIDYVPEANFSGSDSFTFRASDGALSSNIATVNITVTNVNDVPVAQSLTLSTAEDLPLSIKLLGTDADTQSLTYTITKQPTHGELSGLAPNVIYTPAAGFNGSDSFNFVVNDGIVDSSDATVAITVNAVNDPPQAVDDIVNRTDWQSFDIPVLSNDSDPDGDTLKVIGATAASGTVSFNDTQVSYTPVDGFVGSTVINYTISDGNGGTDAARILLQISPGSSGNNLLVDVPADMEIDADALLTKVDPGVARATDPQGNPVAVELLNPTTFLRPGVNTLYWQATDQSGNAMVATQQVLVNPQVSLESDKLLLKGYSATVTVHLNGQAPHYPMEIPFTVGGSAVKGEDHDLEDGVITITSGTEGYLTFNVFANDNADDRTMEIRLNDGLNLAQQNRQVMTLVQNNLEPQARILVRQGGARSVEIFRNGGEATLSAVIAYPERQNNYRYHWTSSEPSVSEQLSDGAQLTLNPDQLAAGVYTIDLTVEDTQTPALSVHKQVSLKVSDNAAQLGSEDSDHDGIADRVEGRTDSDGDGIPDYLDAIDSCNVLQAHPQNSGSFLAESQPGACLRLGATALAQSTGALQLGQSTQDLFDLVVENLAVAGQNTLVVLPLSRPVPAQAIYRLKAADGQWHDFVENDNNQIMSAPGEAGYCPPPGDERWLSGLHEGDWCIQLQMKDGGVNDLDTLENATIVAPGAVASLQQNSEPQSANDLAAARLNTPVTIDVLANDSDIDGNTLTVNSAHARLGQVSIADNRLVYRPPTDLIGSDTIVYGISDGNGGSASAEVTVTITANRAPVVLNDSAAVVSGQSVIIDVLSNDSDADNDPLTLIAADAGHGTVSLTNDNRLRYVADAGFSGKDTIEYLVGDGFGGQTGGQVDVTVTAAPTTQQPSANSQDNSSGGGALLWLCLMCLGAGYRRRIQR